MMASLILTVAALMAAGPTTPSPSTANDRAQALARSARKNYEDGRGLAESKARRVRFAAGITDARAALALAPDQPDGLLWLAANLGAEALERGKLAALPVLPEMERILLRLDAVAPQHEWAAAARVLGRLYHKAPALISIGSSSKAESWFARALERAPNFPGNLALAADFYYDDGESGRARALALRVLAQRNLERHGADAAEWREIAERIARDTE